MTEAQLYDRDGLFHRIVKTSTVLQGRYEVMPHGPSDLNASNFLSGIEVPDGVKYPLAACFPPVSQTAPTMQSAKWEMFAIRLLFLATAHAGDNQFKDRIAETNTSGHRLTVDWQDMKEEAFDFFAVLEGLLGRMRNRFILDQGNPLRVVRFCSRQNDRVNGVMLSFGVGLPTRCPEESGLQAVVNSVNIEFPDHPTHLH